MSEPTQPRFSDPKVLIPFAIVTLIWGSTWIVIKDQLGVVPPSWSVTYRFLVGGIVMLGVAAFTRAPMRLNRQALIFTMLLGFVQFAFNFNFVYRAESFVTSGLVAVVFALLFVPNALFSRIFLGHQMSARFIVGSLIAVGGIMVLFANEAKGDAASNSATLAGIGFTFAGVISASIANVMQASARGKAMAMAPMLGWSMIWGSVANALFARITAGPPTLEWRASYLIGILYLGVIASAITFSLYFRLIRDIGPARAAYSSVIIPVIAMGFSTVFEGFEWTKLAIAGSTVAMIGMVIALSSKKEA